MQKFKKIFPVFLIIFFVFSFPKKVFSHPLDVGYTNLILKNQETNIKAYFNLSWTQVVVLGEKNNSKSVNDFQNQTGGLEFMDYVTRILDENKNFLSNYFSKKIIVARGAVSCKMENFDVSEQQKMSLLFGRGILINADFVCKKPSFPVSVKNTLLFENFPFQTHIININYQNQTIEKTLNPKNPDFSFDIKNGELKESVKQIEEKPQTPLFLIDNLVNALAENKNSFFLSFIIIYLLGAFHTLEPGHSKSILSALLVHNKFSLKHGLTYSLIFTITHISDILIFGALLFAAESFTSVYTKLPYLEKISALFVGITALLLIKKNIQGLKIKEHIHQTSSKLSFKSQLWLGFISGLAPCLMGWSIFFLMINLKKSWTIFPVILAFAAGIFSSLFLLVLMCHFFKVKFEGKFARAAKYLPLISSVLLLIFSLKALFF